MYGLSRREDFGICGPYDISITRRRPALILPYFEPAIICYRLQQITHKTVECARRNRPGGVRRGSIRRSGRVGNNAVSAFGLGPVESLIGLPQQLFGRFSPASGAGKPE
jgi:hypothetical protein